MARGRGRSYARISTPRAKVETETALDRVQNSLVAAGILVDRTNSEKMRRLIQPWQQRALAYYDLVGEAWFASQFYARHLAQIRLCVGKMGDDGQFAELEDESPATAYLDRIKDPGGTGRSQFQASYGRLMFITGEGYTLVTQPDDEEEHWEFVSSDELRVGTDNQYMRYQAPSMGPQPLTGNGGEEGGYTGLAENATVYRMWRKHPRYSALADSPMKAVLDLFEELLLLQNAVAARVKSRLSAAGILLWPEEAGFKSQDAQKSDEDILDDPLLNELVQSANAAIQNPGSASGVTPIIIRIAAEYIESVKHLQFFDPGVAYPETGLRMEVIRRIALGVDFPPEVLLGMADANHWTSWQIDETTARSHIFPMCQMLCDDLNSSYFRPALREDEIEGWEDLVIGFDASAIVVEPDQSKLALELHAAGLLQGDDVLEVSGFEKTARMKDEEYAKWVGVQLNEIHTALTGEEPEPPAPPQLLGPDGQPIVKDPEEGEDAPLVKGPPQAQPVEPPAVTAAGASVTVERILGAAELSVTRARGLAGARLRSKLKDDERELHRDVPNPFLAAVLGPERVVTIERDAGVLVRGAGAELSAMARGLGVGSESAMALAQQVEIHAAKTLFAETQPALPSGLRAMLADVE